MSYRRRCHSSDTCGCPRLAFSLLCQLEQHPSLPTRGAYHGVELNMIFGNSEAIKNTPESAHLLQLQMKTQRAWAAFVGDPHYGLEKLGWPRFPLNDVCSLMRAKD